MDVLKATTEFDLFVLMAVVVAGPIVAERFRIPGMVGLIIGGMLVGPFMLGWVGPIGLVASLGAIGILYLMYLAGLEFGLRSFLANRTMAIAFGLLGFLIPFGISIWAGKTMLGLGWIGASLVGAMWASNTLVAYPDIQAAGLQSNRSVGGAVAAGVIADLLSLTVLAVASSVAVLESAQPDLLEAPAPPLPVTAALALLAVICLVVIPRIAKWFFVRVGHSRAQRFSFSLAAMAAAASLATWGGIEGLIGAFLVGLGMNRLVPKSGSLFEHLRFVGSTLFVPAFLVSIGLKIDPALLFDPETLVIAGIFSALVVGGKLLAAIVAGIWFRLPFAEIGIMAALSMGQAASTLAIAEVGVELGVFDDSIRNAAVLTIVFAVIVTSLGTRFFIPRVERPTFVAPDPGERVLVHVPEDEDPALLMRFASRIAEPDQGIVVPYVIDAGTDLAAGRARLERAVTAASELGQDAEGTLRVDDSFPEGTLQLSAEHDSSLLILPWGGKGFTSAFLFGSDIDTIGERSPIPVAVAHLVRPWTRVVVVSGDLAKPWHQEDARLAMALARRIRLSEELPISLVTPDLDPQESVLGSLEEVEIHQEEVASRAIRVPGPEDLLIVTAHGFHSAASLAPWRLTGFLAKTSVAVVGGARRLRLHPGMPSASPHSMAPDPEIGQRA